MLDVLRRFFDWLLGRGHGKGHGKPHRLNAPQLEITLMGALVRVNIVNAQTYDDGVVAEISKTTIRAKTGSLPFTLVAEITEAADLVAGAAVVRDFASFSSGTWDMEVRHYDKDNDPGKETIVQFTVPKGTLNAPAVEVLINP